jgi:hypothetical protein
MPPDLKILSLASHGTAQPLRSEAVTHTNIDVCIVPELSEERVWIISKEDV